MRCCWQACSRRWRKRNRNRPPPTPRGVPSFAEPGGSIGLLRAVALTLDNDPNILLSVQDTVQASGVVQEQSGRFDWTVDGQFSWQHQEQELTESAKAGQEDKRNQVKDGIALACEGETALRDHLTNLRAAKGTTGIRFYDPALEPTQRFIGFDTQVRLLEALLSQGDLDGAQTAALGDTRNDLIATEIGFTQVALGEAAQGCAQLKDTLERIGPSPEEEEVDQGRLDLRFQKLTRSGVAVAPLLKGSFDSANFVGKRNGFFVPDTDPLGNPRFSPSGIPLERPIDFGGKNIDDLYSFEVGFEVNVPLMRNRGRAAVAAAETASRIDFDASELFLEHAASESALNTVFAYWNLVAAQESYVILEASVGLQDRVVGLTQDLIDAEEIAGVEIFRANGGLANAKAQLENAGRDVISAQMDLIRAMGLGVEASRPLASEGFPLPPSSRELGGPVEVELVREALSGRRADVTAIRRLVDSGQVLARASYLNLRPKLDVLGKVSSFSRAEDSFSEGASNFVGPSFRVGLNLEKPFGNNRAKGILLQQEALLSQRQIEAFDIERLVRLGVARSFGSLGEAVEQLRQASEAAENLQQTVQAEFDKLEAGETTLLDAIVTEQQQTRALLGRLRAQLEVALLIAELRFESGMLVHHEDGANRITQADLTTIPRAGAD